MHRRWAALFLMALAARADWRSSAAAADADALGAIDVCIERLDADTDIGFERIAARCPQLASRLQSSEWAAWLPLGWQDDYNNLSARSLAELRTLVAHELLLRSGVRTPQAALVRPILAELAARNPQAHGFWARWRSWLRTLFAPEPKSRANWFEQLTGRVSLPEAVLEFLAYATLALVLLLAAFIVVNEWCAFAPQRRRTGRSAASGQDHPQCLRPSSWRDVERAMPDERPRVLLELIAARLTAARRLPASAAFTVRELARAAELSDSADRERLAELASACERLRFSVQAPSPARIARALERGRELFERLGEPVAEHS
jgi:hypothetical protein